jgi:hypothetical protein
LSQTTSILIVAGLIAASLVAGIGVGLVASQEGGFGGGAPVTQTGGNSSTPYVLTMILTTGNLFNATTGDQPAFYVVGPNGLESSANITLPANHLIELVISNYDNGSATLSSPQYANVTGTVSATGTASGTEMVFNNTNINSTATSNNISLGGSLTTSSLPAGDISHTFTVPALNLNVPLETSSTTVAYFMTGADGSLTWLCEAACGSGPNGTSGAMVTPGWMTGVLTVG